MASMIIPPGGVAGFSQMTPASRLALTRGTHSRPASSRRRRRTGTTKKATVRANGRRSTRKMKFGSPAWQKKYKVGKFRKK